MIRPAPAASAADRSAADRNDGDVVTGASSGFGKLTAEQLAADGYRMFGTSRKPRSQDGIEMLQLDVQSDESVAACIEALIARAGRVDLLVNNAGQIHASVIEETSLDVARDVFETNFWGIVRVTRAVLPFMRRQKSGQISNVGSLAGLIGVPGQGFYSASKFALEGYSETLAIELAPLGIGVSLIEPGFLQDDRATRGSGTASETTHGGFRGSSPSSRSGSSGGRF